VRLDEMNVGLLRRALSAYRGAAFEENGDPDVALPADDQAPLREGLGAFVDETQRTGDELVHRYALRLGNARYPFMKLVLQEHLVEGEFFFEVDTHDSMFELQGADEAAAFAELRRFNQEVKVRVEQALSDQGLPTASDLRGLVDGRPTRRAPPNGLTILVVDDDYAIAATVATLLRARGYEVDVKHDGIEAVEAADPDRHDLILMDNEMPRLNGFVACGELKAREATCAIPVLIATAGQLSLGQLDAADGFLVKPFRAELLFSMIEHLLSR
jgi:CheY-like chemotaxis protein